MVLHQIEYNNKSN